MYSLPVKLAFLRELWVLHGLLSRFCLRAREASARGILGNHRKVYFLYTSNHVKASLWQVASRMRNYARCTR